MKIFNTCPLLNCLLFPAVIALYALSGCNMEDTQDASIDADLRTQINDLNRQVITALKNNQPEKILALCADRIRRNDTTRFNLRNLAAQTKDAIVPQHFMIMKQFYERRHDNKGIIHISSGADGEHDYSLMYTAETRKSFVTVGYFEDSTKTIAMLTIYGKYGDGAWKLILLRMGVVKVLGRDAIDWYYRARQQYGNDDLADAANSAEICKALLQPCGEGWHYNQENNMESLPGQIKSTMEQQAILPATMIGIKSVPVIFNITLMLLPDGCYPVVQYRTKLDMQDTTALSRECDSLNAHIGERVQGLDHNNKALIYRVYSKVPAGTQDEGHYYQCMKKSPANWY